MLRIIVWNFLQRLRSEEAWEEFVPFACLSSLLGGESYRCRQDASLTSELCFFGLSTWTED